MATERVTLESSGGLNPRDQQRLDELRAANAQGHPQGVRQDPGAPVNWQISYDAYGNQYIDPGAGGGSGSNYPPFNFDWAKARLEAFDPDHPENSVLGRYYLQKLEETKGDVELAKKRMVEDYNNGLRYSTQEYDVGTRTRAEDLASGLQELGITSAEETRDTRGSLNQKGVLLGEIGRDKPGESRAPESGYAQNFFLQPLGERQALRKQAVERAISRQGEMADIAFAKEKEQMGLEKTRGLEDQNLIFPRVERALQEETRGKAYGTPGIGAQGAYEEAYTKYKVANKIPS